MTKLHWERFKQPAAWVFIAVALFLSVVVPLVVDAL